ncbi:tetratricopeptide repeat protein [Treponema sp. HNW]|uniref:tetratricopeptide repeat protein n=1 Tax=Treponema sp. HNW TaxID=3116654 RepID=UPI003D140E11
MGIPSETELTAAFNLLKEGNPRKAKAVLEEVLSGALENEEILFAVKCAGYWTDVFRKAEAVADAYERAELLLSEWKNFSAYIRQGRIFERALFAVKTGVCTTALELYRGMLNEKNKMLKAEVLSKAGLCNKLLGNYETGIALFQEANTLNPQSADILAELADCYALSGEEKTAKVLFREAFFVEPQKVDNSFLESELFCRLAERTAEQGYSGGALQEWIPVYGVLYGVFNIKRELRALEAGKLKQAVFSLENELKEAGDEADLIVPRLINRYFWLIDHYITTNGERKRINELLLKIKLLDGSIYDMYTV